MKLFSLNEAIHKITDLPADRFGLKSEGRLSPGADADMATYVKPDTAPQGINYVLIGGEVAMDHGQVVQDKLGKPIRFNH